MHGRGFTFCTGNSLYKPLAARIALVLVKGWLSPAWNKNTSRRRSVGNVGIPEGFPRGVGRV